MVHYYKSRNDSEGADKDVGMRKLGTGMLAGLTAFGICGAAEAVVPPPMEAAIRAQITAPVRENTEEGDRSGPQLWLARRSLWMQRLRETIGRDRAMRNMPLMRPTGELMAENGVPRPPMGAPPTNAEGRPALPPGGARPDGPPPGMTPPTDENGRPPMMPDGARPGGPPKGRGPMRRETIAFHVDDLGTDSTGLWREGFFYANRDVTGIGDLFKASYMRSQGINSVSSGYALPLGPDTAMDLDFITQTSEIIGEQRYFGIEGHSYSLGVNLHHTLRKNRSGRTTIGLAFSHTKFGSDMKNPPSVNTPFGVVRLGRVRALDTTENEYAPYVELLHYGDSSTIYHKHSLMMGSWGDVWGSHRGFTKYHLDAFYTKDYAHGQRLSWRLVAQLADRHRLSGYDRLYIGGMETVRGYKERMFSGESGLAGGVEYRAPLGAKKRFSALAFLDYGTVRGGSTPEKRTMVGTGVGLAYDFENIHAQLALGFPLEREVGNAGDPKAGPARLHFTLHAMF